MSFHSIVMFHLPIKMSKTYNNNFYNELLYFFPLNLVAKSLTVLHFVLLPKCAPEL